VVNYPFSEFPISQGWSMVIGLIGFILIGVLVSVALTSLHWFAFAWASKLYPNTPLIVIIGLLMLAADAYIRISSVFFAKSSTDPIAVMFIPIYVGGILIPVYLLVGWLLSKGRAAEQIVGRERR
jgi:hypothetical protein